MFIKSISFYFFVLLLHNLFIYLLVDRHLGPVQLWAVTQEDLRLGLCPSEVLRQRVGRAWLDSPGAEPPGQV